MLRSNDAQLARRAAALIGEFAQPDVTEPAASVIYSLHTEQDSNGQPSYSLQRGDQRVATSHDPEALISQLLWQISGDTVELAEGYLLIHAGMVAAPAGDGVAILGESGTGKTTLVAALVQEGYGYLSDEAAAIELGTGLAHPWPRPLGFHPGSRSLARFRSLFPPGSATSTREDHLPIARIRPDAIAEPTRVRHVIDHCYKPGAVTRLEPLSRAVALVRMGSAAPRLRHDGGRGLALLAQVMEGARAYSLTGGDLDQTVRTVRDQVEQ